MVIAGNGRKIAVGLSGGVDSSVSLILLSKAGWQPIGVSLKLPVWESSCNPLRENACCTKNSFENAAKACEKAGAPYFTVDAREEFSRKIIGYFLSELERGRTPNPCLVCNRDLKLRKLFEWAKKRGVKHVATGHYTKISSGAPSPLLRSVDEKKDQSYGLCLLPKGMLKNLVLPLSSLTKQEVYNIAIEEGLGFFSGIRQSQDLCFVANSALHAFLRANLPAKTGPILDEKGNRIGTHQGLFLYTIGQRRHLSLPATHYVKAIDAKRNTLIATSDRARLLGKSMLVSHFNWLCARRKSFSATVKIRSQQPEAPARVLAMGGGKLRVDFIKPVEGITPGQICALYSGNACLGGGTIEKALA